MCTEAILFKNLDESLNVSYASVHIYLNNQHNNNKRIKIEQIPLVPITFCELKIKRENNTYVTCKALLDSGASSSLITEKIRKTPKKGNQYWNIVRYGSR